MVPPPNRFLFCPGLSFHAAESLSLRTTKKNSPPPPKKKVATGHLSSAMHNQNILEHVSVSIQKLSLGIEKMKNLATIE